MNRILSYLIIGILIPWLFLSCAKDDDVLVGGEDNPITVSFVLSTQNTLTRAAEGETTWQDYDGKILGNDFENQIKSVALIVYNSANEKVAEINEFQYFAANGNGSDGCAESYLLTAEITETIGTTGNYRFVIVANATLKAGDVDNSTYSIADINTTGIPMWGAVTKSVSTNSNVDLGTIHLLRAVAKIELKLASTISSQFNIGDAKITKSNSKGYVFPTAKTVESTLNLNHAAQSFNPLYNESDLSSNLVFTTASDKKSSYIYVTEWATIAENPKIALQILDGSKTYPFEIELKDYVDGKPTGDYHDIVRNHHYQYTITKVNTGAGLDLDCSVLDWEEDLEEWVYSDVPTVSHDGHISWKTGTVSGNRVYLTPSVPTAKFTFGLETPLGASWRAEFVTIKGKQNAFKFTQGLNANISADGSYATGNIGELVTLVVGTTGFAEVENNEAYLRILVVLPDSRTIRVSSMLHHDANLEYEIVQTP